MEVERHSPAAAAGQESQGESSFRQKSRRVVDTRKPGPKIAHAEVIVVFPDDFDLIKKK
jgi:hypothetical protein